MVVFVFNSVLEMDSITLTQKFKPFCQELSKRVHFNSLEIKNEDLQYLHLALIQNHSIVSFDMIHELTTNFTETLRKMLCAFDCIYTKMNYIIIQ